MRRKSNRCFKTIDILLRVFLLFHIPNIVDIFYLNSLFIVYGIMDKKVLLVYDISSSLGVVTILDRLRNRGLYPTLLFSDAPHSFGFGKCAVMMADEDSAKKGLKDLMELRDQGFYLTMRVTDLEGVKQVGDSLEKNT